ncbi:MAG: hypothetical protein U1F23_04230 [Lysobacterales bacterium]
MTDFLQRLKQRKLVQWGLAYLAAAWVLLQVLDMVGQKFGWPDAVGRILIIVACIGFFLTLLLAWYHGERGAQRVTGTELLILALLLAIGGGFLWRVARTPEAAIIAPQTVAAANPSPSAIPPKSIAVLPFENLSDDKANAYFASGMQDEILTRLAGIGALKVISRTSTEQYASHPPSLKVIGAQLGVATILEGSVQKAGGKVRINLQLIDAGSDAHLWAQNYDRDLADVFAVQSEVAQQVATALQARLLPAESARVAEVPTTNLHAHDLYLQARYRFNQMQLSSVMDPVRAGQDADRLFHEAIGEDPDFALAYATLSYMQCYLHWYGVDTSPNLIAEARANAGKALALQPGLAEAHLAMGYVHYWGSRNYDAALAEFSAARAILPNSADAAAAIGYIERRKGEPGVGVAELEDASRLDPRSPLLLREIANSYTMLRRYGEDDAMYARALAASPDDTEASGQRAIARMMQGDTAAAAGVLAAIPADTDPQGAVTLVRFRLQMLLRNPDAALDVLAHAPTWLMSRFEHSETPLASLRAQALALRGDAAGARARFLEAETQLRKRLKNPVTATDASSHLGIVYAGLGRKQDALDAARLAAEQMPLSRDLMVGAYTLERLARVEAQLGDADAAIGHLRQLLDAPAGSVVAVPILKIDPAWDPLRKQAGFQALLRETP